MKRWLLDTSVLVDHLRGVPAAADLLRGAVRQNIELCSVAIVRTEILGGMRPKEERSVRHLLESLRWLDVTPEVADAAGSFVRRYRKSHPTIDVVDYILAGAARRTGAQLMTLNVKHFPMFAGLEPAYLPSPRG